jgi:hypothetical protein
MRWRRQSEREFMREIIGRMERREAREEWKAIHKALLAILDRLEPGDATA